MTERRLISSGSEFEAQMAYSLPNADDFPAIWPVLRRHLDEVRPAATMICCGLSDPRMKIEIEVTARRERA